MADYIFDYMKQGPDNPHDIILVPRQVSVQPTMTTPSIERPHRGGSWFVGWVVVVLDVVTWHYAVWQHYKRTCFWFRFHDGNTFHDAVQVYGDDTDELLSAIEKHVEELTT